ncbi:hypothetical protein [Anaerocolumna sp. MB42-C2]|uniref:hypothetical protein n=1 Tax=Anaerocolumna sp. MB42-C2 TaxID=3070997 RepID=UPI0027E0EDF9|nr:hypothetical protein [Anaerocolumna sp. MB42-C2]WMJ87456.1 hypothetical protein RBU59_26030 [Anaerocolumna sp. MB42-C2]
MNVHSKSNIWRKNVVNCALKYADHIWKPTFANAYHGYDEKGILVNTPDTGFNSTEYMCGWWRINLFNKGIPYNWGGCSTIEEFDAGLITGKYAGNVPDFRDNGISESCVGVDCSGLVTICWGLTERLLTKTIPVIASPLETSDLLSPGDLIALPGCHVMIFTDYVDNTRTNAWIVDASRNTGKVMLRNVFIPDLLEKGYRGYRKNHL